ncbi:unnamed protein product [Somion occarium]|uniref:Fatty acid desaturase domain-containing protein n=1 Tax=Somion occarium TaxID=3059160 RepID=A0ABP1DA15_9APHY
MLQSLGPLPAQAHRSLVVPLAMDRTLTAAMYSEDHLPEFTPMPWTYQDIRAAMPSHLFQRDTARSLLFLARDLLMAALAWKVATFIDPYFLSPASPATPTSFGVELLRWCAWATYWWFQGLIFTGLWVIGHECGHRAFSPDAKLCDAVGFVLHSFVWFPYFSAKIIHHRHHMGNGSMEKSELWVPKTRSELGIPNKPRHEIDWDDYFGDTPIYSLLLIIRHQLFAFPAYIMFNMSGQKRYPKWSNHLNPNSIFFMTKEQRHLVMVSNLGLLLMGQIIRLAIKQWGWISVLKYYGIPWLAVTHWITMFTFIQHTDPVLPHYRDKAWNFQRGAACTVDRDFLGWQGRFFLHNVAHDHVVHHFFPKIPFYNAPEATRYLKAFIGDHYVYSDDPVFKTLWDTFNNCQFVEDEGSVLFYRDKQGRARRRAALSTRSP